MTNIMSDACTINVLYEHYLWLFDDSRTIIDDSRVMLQHEASFAIVIYDCHIL
jgi:hypothetical protein